MKHETDTPETAHHKSMVALLIRLGANPDEAYNATEAMTSETKRVALDLVEGVKLQVLSRLEALHTALMGFKAEVAARFEAIDHRFEAMNHRFEAVDHQFEAVDHRFGSIEREMRAGFKAIEQRFDGMEQGFDRMQAHLDGHLASYRKLLLLLVVPVAVAITAGIGGMIWKAISSWPTGLP
ncbi:MAG: hypothetical protein OXN96_00900 [Bryobacterales bacterium]|nr:hypothetical protein [Bryobacterales bacterium]